MPGCPHYRNGSGLWDSGSWSRSPDCWRGSGMWRPDCWRGSGIWIVGGAVASGGRIVGAAVASGGRLVGGAHCIVGPPEAEDAWMRLISAKVVSNSRMLAPYCCFMVCQVSTRRLSYFAVSQSLRTELQCRPHIAAAGAPSPASPRPWLLTI